MKHVLAYSLAVALGVSIATLAGAQTHKASGTVSKIDAQKSSVTIAHGPVQSLKWPAMSMRFSVKDKALLEKLQPGKKVEFEFVEEGKDYIVTRIK